MKLRRYRVVFDAPSANIVRHVRAIDDADARRQAEIILAAMRPMAQTLEQAVITAVTQADEEV